MAEMIDLKKIFFETRVTGYSDGRCVEVMWD